MSERQDEARDLLGAWALDAVDDVERETVERAIAADDDLAAEARELRETVARIAEHDAAAPPSHVRDAVLTQVQDTTQVAGGDGAGPARTSSPGRTEDQTPQTPQDVTAEAAPPRAGTAGDELAARRRRNSRWRALAAAAALIVAVAIPTVFAVNQADRADRAEQQAAEIAAALTAPGAELVGVETADGARVVAVLGQGSAVFAASGMVRLDDQDYQLWVVHDDEATSAGVLTWHDGQLSAQVENFPADAALALTTEPPGGSAQPTSEPLVVLSSS